MLDLDAVLGSLRRSKTAPLADGWAAPALAARAVREATRGEGPILRGLERRDGPTEQLDDLAGGARFGPWPPKVWFFVLGDRSIAASSPTGVTETWMPERVRVTASERAWRPTPPSPWTAEVELELEGARRIVAGLAVGDDEASARGRAAELARALADSLGVEADTTIDADPAAEGELDPIGAAARLAWSLEGELLVLRDLASAGPRAVAARYRWAAAALAVVAAGLWVTFAIELPTGGLGAVIGTAAVALVLSIAAYAFFEIGRFAGRYGAESLPLAWFGGDRVVVAPWVSRYGAVDVRPHGRFGAAIRTAEINGCAALTKGGETAIELATEHGPIEVARVTDPGLGAHLASAIERAIAAVAAPEKKKTALMRAKAKRDRDASERAKPGAVTEP